MSSDDDVRKAFIRRSMIFFLGGEIKSLAFLMNAVNDE